MIRIGPNSWVAREIALDQMEAAALRGDRERYAYWVDRLAEQRARAERAD